MFHDIPAEIATEMARLEAIDARDRVDGTPHLKRMRQIPAETGRFLALLLANAPVGGSVLEIGASAGYSALWLSLACRAASRTLTTFEILEEKVKLARATFAAAGVEDVVTLIPGDARQHLPGYGEIAFCFLDAEKDIYDDSFDLVVPNLVPGGLLIADNVLSHREALRPFVDRALADERVDAMVVPVGKGLLLARKVRAASFHLLAPIHATKEIVAMPPALDFRNMTRPEVDELVAWAAREGWNPGLHDAELFWATDPEAFIAADLDGDMIGGGAITSYEGRFGFMGFFIVRPEFRGRGFGNALWHIRRQSLLDRLRPGASIGLDGVFEMQSYYAKGGFVFSHRNMRFRALIADPPDALPENDNNVVALADVPFEQVVDYDRTCFPAPRPAFLRAWIAQPDALALGYLREGKLAGYGVVRRCGEGCKIGPLFADDGAAAEALYGRLARFALGGPLFLDAPENNPAAMELVARHDMVEVFGTARMYLGHPPDLVHERIFGVTTFELG